MSRERLMRGTRIHPAGIAALAVALVVSPDPPARAQALDEVMTACADKSKPQSADACTVLTLVAGMSNADFSAAYFDVGASYARQKDYSRAIANYTEAVRLNPRNHDAFFNRGNAYLAQRDFARAIADYSEAIRINPRDSGSFANRGIAYKRQKDFARAIADYNEAIRINPRDSDTFANRCNAYFAQNDFARAIADCNEAIRINPRDSNAFFNRGNAHFAQNDFARAIADYDQAIRINPQNSDAIANRRLAYDRQRAAAPGLPAGVQSVAGYQPSWIGHTMAVRGTVSRFVQRKVNGEPYVYLYFKERPDSTVVACSRDDDWLLGVLQLNDFQSVVGKTLEFNGEVVNGTCSEQGAGLWIWQRNQARIVGGSTR
jgi:tetratricopeptide (TPR) repeat protein